MFGENLLEFVPAFLKSLSKLLGLRLQVSRDFLAEIDAALEDAGEGVIVLCADRVVFVIMASGALDRQSHQAAKSRVDAIIDDVVLYGEKSASER